MDVRLFNRDNLEPDLPFMIYKVKKKANSPVKPVPVEGFLNSQVVFGAPCVCNNAPSLGLNRTAIVQRCGDQTAEPLLVTAVLHLPQPDAHAPLKHHFMSAGRAGQETGLPQQSTKLVWAEGNFILSLSDSMRNWAPVFGICWLQWSLTCVFKKQRLSWLWPFCSWQRGFCMIAQSSCYQIASCSITWWLSNMRVLPSTCYAASSMRDGLKKNLCSLFFFLQRGSDELFSSCISNGPYIMNPGRGVLPWRGNSLYGNACPVWFVWVSMTINPLFKMSQSLLFCPSLIVSVFVCLLHPHHPQLMATTQKNSKVTSVLLVFHHVWSTSASCLMT